MSIDISGLKANSDRIKRETEESAEKIAEIGRENEEVKSRIAEIPDDLDSDLQALIREIPGSVKSEASSDISSIRSSEVDRAKEEAASVKETAEKKISDNAAAKNRLDSISGRYGKSEIGNAGGRLERNSEEYRNVSGELTAHIEEIERKVDDVISNL